MLRHGWWLALGAVLLGALVLRFWGIDHGLPYVYNADENAHFVPRAIGMFGHSYNPGYFINPPAFTYLLHGVFWARWGGDGVQEAYAADAGDVVVVARAVAAVLGAAGVGLLAWAGARMFDRRVGLVAAALLAVAFLPVHYSHLALNDVPTLAPAALALVGIAGVLRRGDVPDYALSGVAIGLAVATKYTAGILLLCLVSAAALAPGARRDHVLRTLLAGAVALGAFFVANPFALLDFDAFREGLATQSKASSDGGGKLGLTESSGILYYLKTLVWGLGWAPALLALVGVVGLARRDHRAAIVLVPAPILFLLFMGLQDRFFARWLLPVYPILCLLAAWGAVEVAMWLVHRWEARGGRGPGRVRGHSRRRAIAVAAAIVVLGAQGAVLSVHNDQVLAREDTRQLVRDWMKRNVPEGTKIVVEPIAPDQWAMDAGRPSRRTGNGNRWIKFHTSRSAIANDGSVLRRSRVVKLEDYERTTRPALVDSYIRGGFCWVVTGSTQFGRAYAEPQVVPKAIAYYEELERRGEVVHRVSPFDPGAEPVPFSYDDSFNYRPLAYARPGPQIAVYRLSGGEC